jgi:hypothetical protein
MPHRHHHTTVSDLTLCMTEKKTHQEDVPSLLFRKIEALIFIAKSVLWNFYITPDTRGLLVVE